MSFFSSLSLEKAREEFQKKLELAGDALEKTGDVLSKVASNNSSRTAARSSEDLAATATEPTPEFLSSLKSGWSNVLDQTKASIAVAEEKVKQQQALMEKRIQTVRTAYYERDIELPLDVPALKDAQVVYVTDRLIAMSHPAMASADGSISAPRKLAAVAHMLAKRHGPNFMVWNLSEMDYDVDNLLNEQVMTYSFPGSPSPPLGMLLKLLMGMESWLKADPRNVAVVHCLTGKGRTSTVLAAFLCWMGEAEFHDIYDAVAYIARCKQLSPEELIIPSQRRYASYFKNMLEGVRPSQPPLMLKRIIMSSAPRFAMGLPRDDGKDKDDETQRLGCAPYLQIFKAGKLLHTSPASLNYKQSQNELPFCQVADGSIAFHIDLIVQGDILVRCRHLGGKKERVSMFRAAIHTGYVPPKVMRLTKAQLDGACTDDRFRDEFFLDLIFETVEADAASKVLTENEADSESDSESQLHHSQPPSQTSATVKASAYDSMLHRDSRFWDVITARREEHSKNDNAKVDPLFGPTIGRRRQLTKKKTGDGSSLAEQSVASNAQVAALETFSIGGELDFLPSSLVPDVIAHTPVKLGIPKQDSLMDSLMAALDDESAFTDTEEIVFEVAESQTIRAEPTIVKLPPLTENNAEAPVYIDSDAEPSVFDTSEPLPAVCEKDEMANLLAEADLDLDADMEGLLGDDLGDDILDLDDLDDAEFNDLESFLSPTNKK